MDFYSLKNNKLSTIIKMGLFFSFFLFQANAEAMILTKVPKKLPKPKIQTRPLSTQIQTRHAPQIKLLPAPSKNPVSQLDEIRDLETQGLYFLSLKEKELPPQELLYLSAPKPLYLPAPDPTDPLSSNQESLSRKKEILDNSIQNILVLYYLIEESAEELKEHSYSSLFDENFKIKISKSISIKTQVEENEERKNHESNNRNFNFSYNMESANDWLKLFVELAKEIGCLRYGYDFGEDILSISNVDFLGLGYIYQGQMKFMANNPEQQKILNAVCQSISMFKSVSMKNVSHIKSARLNHFQFNEKNEELSSGLIGESLTHLSETKKLLEKLAHFPGTKVYTETVNALIDILTIADILFRR